LETVAARDIFAAFLSDLASRTVRINYDAEYDTLFVFGRHELLREFHEEPRAYTVIPSAVIMVLRSTGTAYGVEVQGFGRSIEDYGTPADLRQWWSEVRKDGPAEVDGRKLSDVLAHGTFTH